MSGQEKAEKPFYPQKGQTDVNASIHGVPPPYLIEQITRDRIDGSLYYKAHCFRLTAATFLSKVVELKYIGGTYGVSKPTDFICLIYRFLQLNPEPEIVLHYLHDETYKYLRALMALYVRMTFKAKDVYLKLEPLLADYRKLKVRSQDSSFSILHMDEYIDHLLTEQRVFDIALPNMLTRSHLEDLDELDPRVSVLQAELDGEEE